MDNILLSIEKCYSNIAKCLERRRENRYKNILFETVGHNEYFIANEEFETPIVSSLGETNTIHNF